MRNHLLLIVISILFFSLNLSSQACPNELTFYKVTGSNGSNICVEFNSDPGFGNIVHNNKILTRVGTSYQYKTSGGNCNGSGAVNSPQSFLIGTQTCSYAANGALPVELATFGYNIDSENIMLKWTTSSEINNEYFSVERRSVNTPFEEIGSISGNGNSNQLNSYEFNDRNPLSGVGYYRLKQYDYDGQFNYSKSISVQLNRDFNFDHYADIINLEYKGSATFILYDITGRLIEKVPFSEHLEYDVSALKGKGMFVGTLVTNGNRISQKLLVF